MKLVVLSDHESFGGAAIATTRLVDGLRAAGHEVTRVVNSTDGASVNRTGIVQLRPGHRSRGLPQFWPELVRDAAKGRSTKRQLEEICADADALLVQNLHGARSDGFGVAMLRSAETLPVVWTLHDTWAFTGRCAYPGSCLRYRTVCTPACPTADEYPSLPRFRVPIEWVQRRQVYGSLDRIAFVTPSRWMAELASSSALLADERIVTIPNGLDPAAFPLIDRGEARRRLGLHPDGPVVLLVAHHLDDPRKGAGVLDDALAHLERRVTVVGLGSRGVNVPVLRGGVRLGPSTGPSMTADAYAAADLVVVPSVQDNAPLVVQEALMSGTPVVGTPVGGIPEMLATTGGKVAADLSREALTDAIAVALEERVDRVDIRRDAKRRWHIQRSVDRYVHLLDSMRA